MRLGLLAAAATVLLAAATDAPAQVVNSFTWNINANGIKEVNAAGASVGDPDGTAVGTLTLTRNGTTGMTGTGSFNLLLSNIAYPLSAHHIHQAPSTTTGSVVLFLFSGANPESQRNGDVLSANLTGLDNAVITNILNNPTNFYYNLHNGPFPGGAVRDQLSAVPEPGSLALCGMAGLGLLARRWRRRTKE
jgi:CHRD domain-containing protein/PEP-CTERM motif-containing protein